MDTFFLGLLQMSLSAGILIFVVLVLRKVFVRVPKKIHLLFWAVVALRLLCPFHVTSPFGILPENGFLRTEKVHAWKSTLQMLVKNGVYQKEKVASYREAGILSETLFSEQELPVLHTGLKKTDEAVNSYVKLEAAAIGDKRLGGVVLTAEFLWGIGVAFLLAYATYGFLRLKKKLSEAVPDLETDEKRVYLCEGISTSFVFGLVQPKIYLPAGIGAAQKAYILPHELVHRKRLDHWWKLLGFILLSIYWFCPLVWVAYVLFCRDLEYACDEAVVAAMDKKQRTEYIKTLLSCSGAKPAKAPHPVYFAGKGVCARIRHIIKYKKCPRVLYKASVVACFMLAACFLTSAKYSSAKDFYPQYFFKNEAAYTEDAIVEKYLKKLPEEIEFLEQAGVCVVKAHFGDSLEETVSRARWEEFADKVSRGERALLVLGYCHGGKVERFHYIYYTGEEFYSRWRTVEIPGVYEDEVGKTKIHKYLRSYDVQSCGETEKMFLMTNYAEVTPENINEWMRDYDKFEVLYADDYVWTGFYHSLEYSDISAGE